METQHRKFSDPWDGGCTERDLGRCRESKDIIEDPPIDQGHTEKKMKERCGEGSLFPPHQNSQQSGSANPWPTMSWTDDRMSVGTDKWLNRKKDGTSNNQPPRQCLQGLSTKWWPKPSVSTETIPKHASIQKLLCPPLYLKSKRINYYKRISASMENFAK